MNLALRVPHVLCQAAPAPRHVLDLLGTHVDVDCPSDLHHHLRHTSKNPGTGLCLSALLLHWIQEYPREY